MNSYLQEHIDEFFDWSWVKEAVDIGAERDQRHHEQIVFQATEKRQIALYLGMKQGKVCLIH